MFWVLLAALTAVCGAEKLDRIYLPPATAKSAGGSPSFLQTPFSDDYKQGFPVGGYTNDAEGVIVDAVLPGTRTSPGSEESGLGGPRDSYGSIDSKVGEAAFKDALTGFNPFPTLHRSIPLEDQDPEYQTSIAKEQAIQTKLLQPQETKDHNSNILSYQNNVDIHNYNYGFESDNGIAVGENGVAHDGVHAQGGYSYKGDDGKVYKVTYTADKDGYKPQGDHLPTPHPIPEDIQKSIEQNIKDEAAGHLNSGSYDAQKHNAEGDYKESDSNKYHDTQQSQFEKRPVSDAPINGASIIQSNFPASGLSGSLGSASSSSVNKPANSFTTGLSNAFNSQVKPLTNSGQGQLGDSASFGQTAPGSSFKPQTQTTGFGTQSTQQGLKPQFGQSTVPQFGAYPISQQGQFGSQSFQTQGLNSAGAILNSNPTNQYPQGLLQDSQLNSQSSSSNKPSLTKPITPAQGANSKPYGSSFGSTTNSFGQASQIGLVNNAYSPPAPNKVDQKPSQILVPQQTNIPSSPTLSASKPIGSLSSTVPQISLLGQQDPSVLLTATVTGKPPPLGFQTPEALNIHQKPSKLQFTPFTQTSNYQLASSQEQAYLNHGSQEYPAHGGSHGTQQQKPIAETPTSLITSQEVNQHSLSGSSSLSTQTPTNQSPLGTHLTTGQVSQFGSHSSNIPETSQTLPHTSSFTSSSSPSNKPLPGSYSNTQAQTTVSSLQQVTEKEKFTQSSISTEKQSQSELSQKRPSNTQNVFSAQLPVSSEKPQSVVSSYYYNQPTKPFSTPAAPLQVSSFPPSTSGQFSQGIQPSSFPQLQGSQKEQSAGLLPTSHTPTQAQLIPTSSYTSVTQGAGAATLFPSQFPVLSTSFPQKPILQSFSQATIGQKPTTNEVAQADQSKDIVSSGNKKPLELSQNKTPQPTPTKPYTGELYHYDKPAQELSVTANKNSGTSGQIEQQNQVQSVAGSIVQSQQSQKETTAHFETAKPQVGQSPLSQQVISQSSSISTNSQEQSKPGSTQFGTQPYKPLGSTLQFGTQPFKPFTTTTQFVNQPYKPSGSTTQFGTQTNKPFGSTTQYGTQPYKPFGATTQFGVQPVKTTQFGTQPIKPFGSTSQIGDQQYKPFGSAYKPFGSSYKPFGSSSQFGSQPVKPQFGQQQQSSFGQTQTGVQSGTASSIQFNSQPTKPFNNVPSIPSSISQAQFGAPTIKPQFGQAGQNTNTGATNTNQFGTKPQISQPIFSTAQTPISQVQSSTNQHSGQPAKPISATQTTQYQTGAQSKPQLGQTYPATLNNQQQSNQQTQFAAQSYKPFSTGSATLSEGSLSQTPLGVQTTKPEQVSQQGGYVNAGTLTTIQTSQDSQETTQVGSQSLQTGYGSQSSKPFEGSSQFGSQPVKPQLGQNQQSSYGQTQTGLQSSTPSSTQLGSQPSKPFSNVPSTSSSLSQTQFGGQVAKPQFGQAGQNTNTGATNTNLFGTKPQIGQSVFSTAQTPISQVQSSDNHHSGQPAKPITTTQTTQYQIGAQYKPQLGQTYPATLNNQQQSNQQTQFAAQSYKPFSTGSSTSSEGSLSQTQFGVPTAKPEKVSLQGSNVSAGTLTTIQTSQASQESTQDGSQSSQTEYGSQSSKPFEGSSQFGSQPVKPQLGQNQQSSYGQTQTGLQSSTASSTQFSPQPTKPFSYVPSTSSSLSQTQFGVQAVKPQFGQIVQTNTNQFGTKPQTTQPILSTPQTLTSQVQASDYQHSGQSAKPITTTQTEEHKTTQYQIGAQSKPQLGETYPAIWNNQQQSSQQTQFGVQSYKPTLTTIQPNQASQETTQISSQSSQTGYGSQSSKPFGSTSQLGTQQYKPLQSSSQFGPQPIKPQLGQQQQSNYGQTQTGLQSTAASSTQLGSQPSKPFSNVPSTSSSLPQTQFGVQAVKPQLGQNQQSSYGQTQTGVQSSTASSTQLGSQPSKPFSNVPSTSSSLPQTQFGVQAVKPQLGQNQQSSYGQTQTGLQSSTASSTQLGSQPSKPFSNVPSTSSSLPQTQFGVQAVKPQLGQNQQSSYGQSQTGLQSSTASSTQFSPQPTKPFSYVPSTSSSLSQTQFGVQAVKPQFGQIVQTNTNQFGTKPQTTQPIFSTPQTLTSQVQASDYQHSGQSAKPITTTQTEEHKTIQYQIGAQSKPQLGETYPAIWNNQQQSSQQTEFGVQSYKPFGTGLSTSNEGSLSETQFGVQSTKPHQISYPGQNANVGGLNSIQSGQSIQGTEQTVSSQSSQAQFGDQASKNQETKYQYGAHTKPQFGQNQHTISNNQHQTAFGSQSYKPIGASTPFNFGNQQIKNQFGQSTFPNFGAGHATATASSHSVPGFQFGNAFQPYRSQFGQNFPPSHSSAFASATNGPENYRYNKPTPQSFTSFSARPFKQFGTASTPVFLTSQPQFGHPTTPSYGQKLSSFESSQGPTTFGQGFNSQFNTQTIKPSSAAQVSVVPPKSSSFSTQFTQTTQGTPSYGSTVSPTIQSSIQSQKPQDLILIGQLKPEEGANKGEKFSGTKEPQRFDEKTGYYY